MLHKDVTLESNGQQGARLIIVLHEDITFAECNHLFPVGTLLNTLHMHVQCKGKDYDGTCREETAYWKATCVERGSGGSSTVGRPNAH